MALEYRQMPLAVLRGSVPGIDWHVGDQGGWEAAIARFGVLRPLVVNRRSGRVLSSPVEFEALTHIRQNDVPVVLVDVALEDEQVVALILSGGIDHALLPRMKDESTLDVLLALAQRDLGAVRTLGITLGGLGELLEILSGDDPNPPEKPLRSVPNNLAADAWGIPMLDPTLQGEQVAHAVKWGTFKRGTAIPGCLLHFYTDDSKFAALLKDTSPVVAAQPSAVVEANFSTSPHMPGALALYRIYQKRTLAAAWQTQGLRVLVDLNVDRAWFELALLGVPEGWRAYANRAVTADLDHLVGAHALAAARRGSDDLLYVVYGGGEKARQFCEAHSWHWLPEDSDHKRGRADG